MRLAVLLSLLLMVPGTARAEWLQASSAHFVVYANDSERDIRRFSEQLERYHEAMAVVTGSHLRPPSPSNRVTVYVVSGERAVRDLYGEGSKYVGGFYIPRAGGSLAIVPQVNSAGGGEANYSMIVLLHEYAHHFMASASAFAPPRWFSEGGAEFFASASFEADGSLSLGRPAHHRAGELFLARDVKAADLIDPTAYDKRKSRSYDAFYGKSWLLYHYLTFDEARKGQLARYLRLLVEGKTSREAGLEAFGDFDVLERNLDAYLDKPRMLMLKLPAVLLETGPIAVRRLSAGEAAMMPVTIRSRRGVTDEQAAELLIEARAIAARFPGDAAVLSALAEAEYDAGNDAQAIAAANAALAIDPGQVNAYVQKGYALFRMAEEADDQAAAYGQARAPFVALNRLENDHPIPLIYFYYSFVRQGLPPSKLAVEELQRAVDMAPFDIGLRMTLATQQLHDRRGRAARANLVPIAYNPHGGKLATAAQAIIARLDSDPGWDGADVSSLIATAGEEEGETPK